jgi:predicted GNAT superfamily acetyltransferase
MWPVAMVGADNDRGPTCCPTTNPAGVATRTLVPVPSFDYRLLRDPDELAAASEVIGTVWGDPTLATPSLLRAYTHFGNPAIGAFAERRMCGVSVGFLAPSGGVHLHSHITGVLPEFQHLGVGLGLKSVQRDWCLEHGIDEVTWTFDPMLARNAAFNLRKLGARAWSILPNFYGAMDDAVNRGDETDRLEVHWSVSSPAVADRLGGHGGAAVRPARTVALPPDYAALRAEDAEAARAERKRVRVELEDAFATGLAAVDFVDGEYWLVPTGD